MLFDFVGVCWNATRTVSREERRERATVPGHDPVGLGETEDVFTNCRQQQQLSATDWDSHRTQ